MLDLDSPVINGFESLVSFSKVKAKQKGYINKVAYMIILKYMKCKPNFLLSL